MGVACNCPFILEVRARFYSLFLLYRSFDFGFMESRVGTKERLAFHDEWARFGCSLLPASYAEVPSGKGVYIYFEHAVNI